ncbi:ATP-dependent DNA ligase [Bradyrhizobium sp. 956_D2_N1_5]|uniref:ATP-dependent DNA ligase n=1 Tax=unclassified Bradyrhizobium TaxID=2631580 RepID=UPI003F21C15A
MRFPALVHRSRLMAPRIEFAIPVKGIKVPTGPDWLHEIKHDGYRIRLVRDGKRVRLITKGGHDWTDRFPWIVETAHKLRSEQFILDGEAVVLGADGNSDFRALHSRKHDHEVQFYAFDILGADGDDYRRLPLTLRKTNLARLLRNRAEGIHAAPFEQGEIGADLFRHACIRGSKAWSRSISTARTARGAVTTGSRTRTRSTPPTAGCRISSNLKRSR